MAEITEHTYDPWFDGATKVALVAEVRRLRSEVEFMRRAVLNQCGDNLCHLDEEALADLVCPKGKRAQPPPRAEFLKSCERFIDQVISERGEMQGCMTIAQLEADNERLRGELAAATDQCP